MPTDVYTIIADLRAAFVAEPEPVSAVETLDLLVQILRDHDVEDSSLAFSRTA